MRHDAQVLNKDRNKYDITRNRVSSSGRRQQQQQRQQQRQNGAGKYEEINQINGKEEERKD